MIEKEKNELEMSVSQMVSQLSEAYIAMIRKGISFKNFPSVMLWGAPGVGKSQGIRQIAKKMETETGKQVRVTDVRLLLFNPVDLRGIPTANAEKTLAVWLKPQIFQMDESEDVVNILLLDEISAAPPSVQAAAYQITLDRVIGEHRLPENCIVIAAGNRITDRSVAYKMPKALSNRLCHLHICSDYKSWHDWAIEKGMHESVVGFLEYKPELLHNENNDDYAFSTPRSWEMVSNILEVSPDISKVYPMIVGCIGEETAYKFREWCEIFREVPSVCKIFVSHLGTYIFWHDFAEPLGESHLGTYIFWHDFAGAVKFTAFFS